MKRSSVDLISFGAPPPYENVRDTLLGLGYRIRVLPCQDWLSQSCKASDQVAVLLLGNKDIPYQEISSAISNNRPPCLTILPRNPIHWETNILTGCDEFMMWPFNVHELDIRLRRLQPTLEVPADPFKGFQSQEHFEKLNMVGRSPAFLKSLALIRKIARCDATVLIEGETGTGKELAARAIHYNSARRDYPFIPVNCGALPDNLIENELFGHERGAYTDARCAYTGLIGQAKGGTLFLDEIETLSSKGQVTLLRFLEECEYRPLGGKKPISADVRVLTASNTNIARLVGSGDCRQDLYYRLNIMTLTLPPLREREGDAELLAEHFLNSYSKKYRQPSKTLHPDTANWMRNYHWPGNVRELENLVHREFLLAEEAVINIKLPESNLNDLNEPEQTSQRLFMDLQFKQAKARVIDDFEKLYLMELMSKSRGNVTVAAKRAGKERRALGKLLQKHGIDRTEFL